jgi:hypothetical protein
MKELSPARFLAFLPLWSLAVLCKLAKDDPVAETVGGICFLAAMLVVIPSSELHRKVSWSLRAVLFWLLVILVLMGAAMTLGDYLDRPLPLLLLWATGLVSAWWRRFWVPQPLTGEQEG